MKCVGTNNLHNFSFLKKIEAYNLIQPLLTS